MHMRFSAALVPLIFAGAAVALPGVQTTDVIKRHRLMLQIRDASTTLVAMARGETVFDADRAARLAGLLREDAAAIPIHFEFQNSDPDSRARPEVWADWTGFEKAAARSEAAAAALQTEAPEPLRRGIEALQRTCQNCHRRYRFGK
ncbi:c-type cytochrome [Puniceibacterium confluentis]|uniref:c-type cytochrome n=1 Tax=Puniceibacterium confluentis TaxID=1958944 RepID=UPI0011B38E98|nr:cytochrome c [Puniceibacterium confluentis]